MRHEGADHESAPSDDRSSVVALPPSVLQTKPKPGRTERYVHINTLEIIHTLEGEGFEVSSVEAAKTRRRDPLYGKHQVILRHKDAKSSIDGIIPQFLFTNAHDGSASAWWAYGAFRFICSNGLVVGTTLGRERVRHAGDAAASLIERVRAMARNTTPLFDQIDRWSHINMTDARQRNFARLATTLRWDNPNRFDPVDVLRARRPEDEGDDVWRVFNRVQENIVRGGLEGMRSDGRSITSSPIASIQGGTDFNSGLWQLAEDFALLPA